MSIFAVRYTYDERSEVRDAVRPEHRSWLADQAEAGVLLGSGPFTDGAPGALLVLRGDDIFTPSPGTVLRVGDHVLVAAARSDLAVVERRLHAVSAAGRLAGWYAGLPREPAAHG